MHGHEVEFSVSDERVSATICVLCKSMHCCIILSHMPFVLIQTLFVIFCLTLQSLKQSILKCKYVATWPSSLTPFQACENLDDPDYHVPYKCSPSGQKLCCGVSNMNFFTTHQFGICEKVMSHSTGISDSVGDPDEVVSSSSSSSSGSISITSSSSSSSSRSNTVQCSYISSWPSSMTPTQACNDLDDPLRPVAYKCTPTGQKLCCSVSDVDSFTSGNFGLCEKVVSNSGSSNTVQCSYISSWPSSMTPAQACDDLNDPQRPVSYKCTPSGQKLCCSVSDIDYFTSGNFGLCQKVVSDSNGDTPMPTRKPTAKPTVDSGGYINYIHCDWFSFYKFYDSAPEVCEALNDPTHPVPYLCEDGRKLCCTVSDNVHPTFDKFGTCHKV